MQIDGMLQAQDTGKTFSYVYSVNDGVVVMVTYFDHAGDVSFKTRWFI